MTRTEPQLDTVALAEDLGVIGYVTRNMDNWVKMKVGDVMYAADLSDIVTATMHARTRFIQYVDEETDNAHEAILKAWRRGTVLDDDHGMDADEVKYDMETEAAYTMKEGEIVTVVPRRHAKPSLERAIARLEDLLE